MPDADENDSWQLQDGQTYSQDTFYQPKVSAKFYNSKVTFDVKLSFTTAQVKESFDNVNDLNAFVSMLETGVKNSMTVKLDSLIMRTINNFTGQIINNGQAMQKVNLLSDYNMATGQTLTANKALLNSMTVKLDSLIMRTINNFTGQIINNGQAMQKVNLLSDYNMATGQTLTANKALLDKDFLKYASLVIKKYQARITKMSTLFNQGAKARFTNINDLHTVLLADFADSADVYLMSDTYHNETVSLPQHETVPYWQGSGTNYDFKY